MASDNQRFWTTLSILILMVAIAVTLIDLSIKAAILQESNDLRRVILNGRREASTDDYGDDRNRDSAPDVLDIDAAGMENPDVSVNGATKASATKRARPTKPRTPANPGEIPE